MYSTHSKDDLRLSSVKQIIEESKESTVTMLFMVGFIFVYFENHNTKYN